jgi:hypothetical protein
MEGIQMTDIAITSMTDRFGGTFWAVTWGKGLTQTRMASSYEEALSIALGERQWVEPLVTFG